LTSAETIAAWVTIAGFPAAIITLIIAIQQGIAGRRTASAGIYLTINQALRDEWRAFDNVSPQLKENHLGEVLNLIEIACGVNEDGVLAGNSGYFLRHTIDSIQDSVEDNPYLQALVSKLRTHEHTFAASERYRSKRLKERARGKTRLEVK